LTKVKKAVWFIPLCAALFAHFSHGFSSFGVYPLISQIQGALSLSESQIATFAGVAGIASMVAVIPAGILCQKVGSKKVAVFGLLLSAIGLLIVALSKGYGAALTGRIIWQFFYRVAFIGTMAITIAAVPESFRGRAVGFNGAAASMGSIIGAPVAVAISSSTGSWTSAFYAFIIVAMLGALAAGFLFKPYASGPASASRETPKQSEQKKEVENQRNPFTTPLVWLMALVMLFFSSGAGIIQCNSLILNGHFAVAAAALGGVAVVASGVQMFGNICGLFVTPLMGVLSDKLGGFKTLMLIAVIQFALYLGMATFSFPVFLVCCALVQFLAVCSINMVYAAAPELLKGLNVGAISGVAAFGTGLAQFIVPKLLGAVKEATGYYTIGILSVAGMAAVAFGFSLILYRYCQKRHSRAAVA
jgi:NNP family nitrate/nitrite transporter-like MFS transporter